MQQNSPSSDSIFTRRFIGMSLAGAAAFSMSTLFSAMKPILLTRFVEEIRLSEAMAGLIVALPFAGIAVSSLLFQGPLLQRSYTWVCLVFGVTLIATEALSAIYFESLIAILSLQFLSGICVGILMGTISRHIATTTIPGKLFGAVDMTAVLMMSFMVYLIGSSVANSGLAGGYITAALICLIFAGVLFCFRPESQGTQSDAAEADNNAAHTNDASLNFSVRPLAVVGMGVVFVTFSGLGFAFMFTMAANLGMDYNTASSQIGVLLFVSAFACLAGGWASGRFGPERPLLAAFIVCAAGWQLATHAATPTIFLVGLVPAIFALQFCFPILLSFSASLDTQGKWAAVASPIITSGFAWAAIVAGQTVGIWGINALANATTFGMLLCGLLLAVAYRNQQSN